VQSILLQAAARISELEAENAVLLVTKEAAEAGLCHCKKEAVDTMEANKADALHRAEAAEAKLAVAVERLTEIARQKKTDELETEYDVECASFEDGFDFCVDRARAALRALAGGEWGDPRSQEGKRP